eukprot:Phypoly_transcript_12308.p1 GENE.Phypoly_transcript_12308~~Phypoly_transcript_12308.p1  ORF type:complete len:373 (+),score=53.00 Phypoly_transcript_12308:3-1121(+)
MGPYLLILSACIVVCIGGGFSFTGNFSAKAIKHNKWNFLNTQATIMNKGPLYTGANFESFEISGDSYSGTADITVGCAYIVTGGFPFAYFAHFLGTYNATTNENGRLPAATGFGDGQDYASMDMTDALGYVGTAALWLEERNANNTIVATRSLQSLLNAGAEGMTYTLSGSSGSSNIQYITFAGTSNDPKAPNFGVKITYLATRAAGIIAGDGATDVPVVPSSLESIFTINNYPYQNPQNSISLVLAVATGSADVTKSGQTVYDASKAVYFSVSKNAVVTGAETVVNISAFTNGNLSDIGNSNLQQQLNQKYGAHAAIKNVRISFPPGEANIVYDPSIGTGISALDSSQQGSSSFTSPFLCLVIVMSSLLVL